MDLYKFTGTEMINMVWQDIEIESGSSYYIGNFEQFNGEVTEALRKSLFIQPTLLMGSDYSGGSVNQSNYRVFLDTYGEVEGVYKLWGGYGTYGVVIRLDVYEENTEIKETLDALEDYPLIDEEDHSTLEFEWEQETMTDIVKDLCQEIDLETYIPNCETLLEDTETIERYAWDGINDLNLEWLHENNSAYLRETDKLKTYVEDTLLIKHCKKLPLLINREWSCNETEQMFKDKLSCKEALC